MAATAVKNIETRLFINGEFRNASSGKTFDVVYPFTQETIASVQEADAKDVDDAVQAAHAAFPAWRDLGVEKRGEYLRKLSQLIEKHIPELAKLEALNIGRPVSHFVDGPSAVETFRFFADSAWHTQGTASHNTPGIFNVTVKEPYGVAGLIIPWNFPLANWSGKIAPALLLSLYAARLAQEAGFPPGVINVLSGYGTPAGAALSEHPLVRCVSFTGSSMTGQRIQAAAAKSNMKHVHLELVFEDSDLEAAALAAMVGITFNSGQVCVANSRIYVQESVAEAFGQTFKALLGAVKQGDPLDPATTAGPQIDKLQFEKIKTYLEIGRKEGKLALGGDTNNGYFVTPTVFEGLPEDSRLVKEEIFGPVVVLNTFKEEAEAIHKANDTEFGLYASVFTKDLDRAVRVSRALQAGLVGVNCTAATQTKDAAFGGYKRSGIGREGLLYSIENFLQTKSIIFKAGAGGF
ncbi:hypothetical protein N7468_001095 [Penicillium chermesinum]|uniref:aldehyde dehydrogenase (NAD(+)) n=1 Tax=Penicillium chermesinum TaxID=63820 RepID=A0A9W9TWP6_9EURO|nr:uncharacterized protein N7468_001095 [Penicillium chermesinum]KAJ5246112.1 hypothetical protein N7468_001095 [Penicillium chermesinum]